MSSIQIFRRLLAASALILAFAATFERTVGPAAAQQQGSGTAAGG